MTIVSAQSGVGAKEDKPPSRRPLLGQVEMLPDAPDFELKTLDGKAVHLRDYRGKAVLLNFWATYCVPCKEEMPWLVAFQKQYGPKGLVILGIAMDQSIDPIRKFAAKMEVSYPVLIGNQRTADQYYVKGLPVSIFIDRNGRITDQVPGGASRSFLENEIQLALENGVQPTAR
jgi:cytochrome c biogenesis protein CcmG/thiol:disulfide interchange protein DsbE